MVDKEDARETNFMLETGEKATFMLVTGETGDGKSSLIDYFQAQTPPEKMKQLRDLLPPSMETFDNAAYSTAQNGTTKDAAIHPAMIGKQPVFLIDTPGFGDVDTKPQEIMAQIDAIMTTLAGKGGNLGGVVLCSNSNNHLMLGAQMVLRYCDALFPDENKWEQILIVGTKKDILVQDAISEAEDRLEGSDEEQDEIATAAKAVETFKKERLDVAGQVVREARAKFGFNNATLPRHVVLVNKRRGKTPADMDPFIQEIERIAHISPMECRSISDEQFVQYFADIFHQYGITLTVDAWTMVKSKAFQGWRLLKDLAGFVSSYVTIRRKELFGHASEIGATLFEAFCDRTVKASLLESMLFHAKDRGGKVDHEYCALLSALVYDVSDDKQLDAALQTHGLRDHKFARVMNGADEDFRQPCAVSLVGKTLYVAWRGTQSIMSVIMDMNATPTLPASLGDIHGVQVHAAMWASAEHDFTSFAVRLAKRISEDKLDVQNVVFTGHSLGGGIAQLAQVLAIRCTRLHFSNLNKTRDDTKCMADVFSEVNFHSVKFAAPMVLNIDSTMAEGHTETRSFLARVKTNSVNYVFAADVVPRLPGHVAYWKAAVTLIADSAARDLVVKAFSGINVSNFYRDLAKKTKEASLHQDLVGDRVHMASSAAMLEPQLELDATEPRLISGDDEVDNVTAVAAAEARVMAGDAMLDHTTPAHRPQSDVLDDAFAAELDNEESKTLYEAAFDRTVKDAELDDTSLPQSDLLFRSARNNFSADDIDTNSPYEVDRPASEGVANCGVFSRLIAEQFFGGIAASIVTKQLSVFLEKVLTPPMQTMLQKYQHVGHIQYAHKKRQGEDWVVERKTDKAFKEIRFPESPELSELSGDATGAQVLECHSVFPYCFGSYLIQRQQLLKDYRHEMLRAQGFQAKEG